MHESLTTHAYGEVMDAIDRFLAKPPEGTPSDIIEAFGMLGGNTGLPPQLFLETVEQAPVAISITDPKARIMYVNRAFEQLTLYKRGEVIGLNESKLSSKSTPKAVYQDLWKTIKDGKVWRGTLVNHRKAGGEYLAELTIAPVLNARGGIAYFLGMHRDVTDMHALQQRLAFQKGLTEAALDAAPMVVAMIDARQKVLLDNHAYKALLGDLRGVEPARLFLDALQQQLGFDFAQVCDGGQEFTNVDIRLEQPGGREPRWFTCSGVRIANFHGDARSYFHQDESADCCLLLIANEVTSSRKRINEARLNMIRAGMAEQQMVQTMREAISASMFKFQVPINVIRAAMSMTAGGGDPGSLLTVLQQALESGEEAMESLHNALPGPLSEETFSVNVNELLHEVLNLSTDLLLANGIVVDWRASPVLPSIHGRPNALRALFKYLVDNAIEALRETRQDYREMRLETRAEGNELLVAIMDNGVGISESDVIKVFEPFHCGWSDPRGHAGMGLTMAQEVALGHRGGIEIDRHFLGGSRLFVRLPLGYDGESDDAFV